MTVVELEDELPLVLLEYVLDNVNDDGGVVCSAGAVTNQKAVCLLGVC